MTTPSGRKFDTDGDASTTAKNGETFDDVAEDSLIVQNSMKPGYKPSPEEVAAEVERIKELNPGLKDPFTDDTEILIASD